MWLELGGGDRNMNQYYLITPPYQTTAAIVKMPEWTFISQSENNPDYQAYLAWVAEGNVAEEWSPNAD